MENSQLLDLYRKMLLTRKMEQKHAELLASHTPVAFAHFSTGQEAVGIGATAALRKEDVMIGSHRGFVEYIGKGMDPVDLFAEYLGKKRLLNGHAGIQVSDRRNNIPGMTAAIGGSFTMAAGIAYALKLRREDRVVMLSYGDGGYNQADAHPSMVVASSLKLPLLYHVPYNGWCEYTPSEEFNPTKSIAARGAAYNIPARSIDGQRVEEVYEAAQQAADYVRSGKGPYIMEYKTYRMGPHWSGDKGSYIPESLKRSWAENDPIRLCRETLVTRGIVSAQDLTNIARELDQIVGDALQKALALPYPSGDEIYAHVYA